MPAGTALVPHKTNHPYLRIVDFRDGGIDESALMYVPADVFPAICRYTISPNDIYVSIVGTIGLVGQVPPRLDGANLTENAAKVTDLQSHVSPEYLRYYLQSPEGQHQIRTRTVGSTQPKLALFRIEEIEVPIPPLPEQREITSLLRLLEARLALLRQSNATVESIAQALFKSWFIDFDPVRAKAEGREPQGMDAVTAALFPAEFAESPLGLIPKGWGVEPIGDLVEAVGGSTPDTKNSAFWEPAVHHWTSPKDLSGATSPVLLDTERKVSPAGLAKISSGLLPAGSLLMSSRAPIGYLTLTQVPVAINQGYIAMLPGGLLRPLYLYFWCKANMDGIKGRANGSTFMEISKKAFRPIPALLPPQPVIDGFVEVACALFERLVANERQARALVDLRDALLPRLISGKLRLPGAQAQFEEALA